MPHTRLTRSTYFAATPRRGVGAMCALGADVLPRTLPPLLIICIALQGCVGVIDDTAPREQTPEETGTIRTGTLPNAYVCDPQRRGSANGMRRLSNAETRNMYISVLGDLASSTAMQALFALLPTELPHDPGLHFDNTNVSFATLLAIADSATASAMSDSSVRQSLLGSTCGAPDDPTCVEGLVTELAPRVYRRPLTAEEAQGWRDYAIEIGGADGLAYAMTRLLLHPTLTQLIEVGTSADAPVSRVRLTSYEVASRLAFYLTAAPPDSTLLSAAAEGRLETVDDIRTQAQRLLETPAAHEKIKQIVRDWLALTSVPDPASAVAYTLGIDPLGYGAEALDELLRFADYIVFEKRGSFRDLLMDKTAFPTTSRLATVYGMPMSTSASAFDDERGGVLVRAATLAQGLARTSPIYRGVAVRDRLLCGALPGPSAEVIAMGQALISELSPLEYSTREVTERATEPAACQGCHALINPLGFALESLGSAGEHRDEELVFDDAGNIIARHAIVTTVDDLLLGGNDVTPATGAAELVAALATQRTVSTCFASGLIANTRMRGPSADDGCVAIATADALLANDIPVLDALVANVANEDIFLRAAE